MSPRPAAAAALIAWALAFACAAALAFAYPTLTGRVVDSAGVLSAETKQSLTAKLADLESRSTIQLVVATVASLEGQDIEPYANELFRAWKLGQAEKNNGVLLLVALKEHKARIEVGYGLEGTLTDAISKLIIVNAIAPRFKSGDFNGGVTRGVDDIITTLTTDAAQWQGKPDFRAQKARDEGSPAGILIVFAVVALIVFLAIRYGRRGGRGYVVGSAPIGRAETSGGGSSSRDSDSFSGGGGSSGGGGASGDW